MIAAFFGGLWTFVKLLPTLLSIGKTLIGYYVQFESAREAAAHLEEFHAGVIEAHKNGDTSGLEKLFNGGDAPAIPAGNQQLPNQPANP